MLSSIRKLFCSSLCIKIITQKDMFVATLDHFIAVFTFLSAVPCLKHVDSHA